LIQGILQWLDNIIENIDAINITYGSEKPPFHIPGFVEMQRHDEVRADSSSSLVDFLGIRRDLFKGFTPFFGELVSLIASPISEHP